MIEPIRLIAFASLVLLTISPAAVASGACTEQSLRKSLKQIEGNLAKPSVQAQIAKAQADFAPDQDFDDIGPALYLDAYALYADIKRYAGTGAIDAACAKYEESLTMFDLLEAAE